MYVCVKMYTNVSTSVLTSKARKQGTIGEITVKPRVGHTAFREHIIQTSHHSKSSLSTFEKISMTIQYPDYPSSIVIIHTFRNSVHVETQLKHRVLYQILKYEINVKQLYFGFTEQVIQFHFHILS